MILATMTPAAGKRLIARAVARHPAVREAIRSGTVVIIAGTTNGCVAEEVLSSCGDTEGFSPQRFFRGITLPPDQVRTDAGRLPDESEFPGDVVIDKGNWLRGKTVFDVIDDLEEGDVILKGANALDLARKQAGVLIGHPQGGTIVAALRAVVGRRVRLLLPVGLEKRVSGDVGDIAARMNAPGADGPRMLPVSGDIISELEALTVLTGVDAELVAAGGVCGAEGSVWVAVSGTPEQEQRARDLVAEVGQERPFTL